MKRLLLPILFLSFSLTGYAQSTKCASMDKLNEQKSLDPTLAKKMSDVETHTQTTVSSGSATTPASVTIPVVVHVVYNISDQNISEAQIRSQIDVLNKDFRKLNADASLTPAEFASRAADTQINFVLASVDPNGAPTTGITRTYSKIKEWGTRDDVKDAKRGGVTPWNTSKYLNIWVCNIGKGILGYAQFPGGAASTDGVVVTTRAFGSTGYLMDTYNKGRTATHEVGHWLNLRHIWGDAACGDDFVSDTPSAGGANFGCPAYPTASCGGNNMTMNYMDYTDDACMYMFTSGQAARMKALFAPGGVRAGFVAGNTSSASRETTVTLVKEETQVTRKAKATFEIYPNPATTQSMIKIQLPEQVSELSIHVSDLQGKTIYDYHVAEGAEAVIDASAFKAGMYIVTVTGKNFESVKELVVTQ